MRAKRWISGSVAFVIGAAVLLSAVTIPTRRAEASDAMAAAVIGGITGLIIGSEIQAANQQQMRCRQHMGQQRKMNQRLLIREVLRNYHPDRHDQFIEYVMFDLQGHISQDQQRQLLNMLEQRHNAYYACCR